MPKVTRISFNSAGWTHPTGDAAGIEGGTYNSEKGFGHEDWLFREKWKIDGWRYAFLQGVNKSYDKLVREQKPFSVTLYTIQPDRLRRYVANIRDVECLSQRQAEEALKAFKDRGWYYTMLKEIEDIGGNPHTLEAQSWAPHILNVRFRSENVEWFPENMFAGPDDPIMKLPRYLLTEVESKGDESDDHVRRLPNTDPFFRRSPHEVVCEPEHARMQVKLLEELHREYPSAQIRHERDYIDVVVQTETELILFEIKSDLSPRTVIRNALGQILEYAFHPNRKHALPVRLVIVGRCPLLDDDLLYFERLKQQFALPLSYRTVTLER